MMAGAAVVVDVDVSGFKTLTPEIRKLVRGAVAKTAFKINADAKRGAPVDTGRLRASIHVQMNPALSLGGQKATPAYRYSSKAGTFDGTIDELVGELDAVVGTNVEYGAAIEYGFFETVTVKSHQRKQTHAWGRPITPVNVTVASHHRKMNVKKRPYIRPAYHKNRNLLKRLLAKDLKNLGAGF